MILIKQKQEFNHLNLCLQKKFFQKESSQKASGSCQQHSSFPESTFII